MPLCRWGVEDNGEVYTYGFEIRMSNAWNFPDFVKENTMAHEMIHVEDYYLNPQNFYYYDEGWVAMKYQAHGNKFFQPEARRLKQFGFDVNTYATKEEMAVSVMNDEARKKVEARRERMQNIRYVLLGATYNEEVKRGQVNVYKLRNVEDARKMADKIKENDKKFFERWGKHKFAKLEYYDVMSKLCSKWHYSKTVDEYDAMYYTAWDKLIEDIGSGARLCEKRTFDTEINPEFFKNLDLQLAESAQEVVKEEAIQGENAVATMASDGTLTTEIA